MVVGWILGRRLKEKSESGSRSSLSLPPLLICVKEKRKGRLLQVSLCLKGGRRSGREGSAGMLTFWRMEIWGGVCVVLVPYNHLYSRWALKHSLPVITHLVHWLCAVLLLLKYRVCYYENKALLTKVWHKHADYRRHSHAEHFSLLMHLRQSSHFTFLSLSFFEIRNALFDVFQALFSHLVGGKWQTSN